MYQIVVYYNPTNSSYYFKKRYFYYRHEEVGFVNGYGHEVILVIDLLKQEKVPIRKRLLNCIIQFLEKLK